MNRIIGFNQLSKWRSKVFNVILTNGCFNILHVGHVRYLNHIKKLFPFHFLVVGINSDNALRHLKNPPYVTPQGERAEIIAALSAVSKVTIFPGFDAVELIKRCKPDIYIKGGDYNINTINPEERNLIINMNIKTSFLKHTFNKSTSLIFKKMLIPSSNT